MTINVEIAAVDDAPIAVAETFDISPLAGGSTTSGNVLTNDIDPDSTTLSAVLVRPTDHGSLSLAANGSLQYTPTPGFTGIDTFDYAVSDGTSISAAVTVELQVNGSATPGAPIVTGADNDSDEPADATSPAAGTESTSLPAETAAPSHSTPTAATEMTEPELATGAPGSPTATGVLVAMQTGRDSDRPPVEIPSVEDVVNTLSEEEIAAIIKGQNQPDAFSDLADDRSPGSSRGRDRTFTDMQNAPLKALVETPIEVDFGALANDATDPDASQEQHRQMMAVGATAVVSTGLSVGYVVWLLRGGTLLASMVSALPAWVAFDPLPVLESFEKQHSDDHGDRGLGELLE